MPYKTPSILAALLISVPLAQGLMTASQAQLLLQVASSEFPRLESIPAETRLRVGSSPSMAALSQAIKTGFETAYAGSEVVLEADSSDAAIASLLAGDVDLAAIGRPLSEAEKDQGLVEVPINREKIAIITGPENSFSRGLTFEQFARIFRGEVTDWAQVGGEPGPIRFVDRPDASDTRQALSTYAVFKGAPFATGATATQIAEDDTAAVIRELGNDGISYAIANHVLDQDGVTIVPMHGTLPDDPRYPYSQPRGYVYRGEPSPAVAAFLGYVASADGQNAIAAARRQEAAAVADALESGPAATTATPPTPEPTAAEATIAGAAAAPSAQAPATTPDAADAANGAAGASASNRRGFPIWLWGLLPLALLGGLLWALSRKRSPAAPTAEAPPWPADPSVTTPDSQAAAAPIAPPPDVEPPAAEPSVTAVEPEPPAATAGTSEAAALSTAALGAAALGAAALGSTAPEEDSQRDLDHPGPVSEQSSEAQPAAPVEDIAATAATPEVTSPSVTPAESGYQAPPLPNIPRVAGAAGLAAGAAAAIAGSEDQALVEASKYNPVGRPVNPADLSDVDQGLADLPDGYGESRIVLLPRDPQWAYAYWDTPSEHKEALRRQGGERLALRLYDVTDINLDYETPHNLQQYDCEELARDWYLPIPVSDRDYLAEIGYLTVEGRWLLLARSNPIHIPPIYPSDWVEDHFLSVDWNEDLRGKTLFTLIPAHRQSTAGQPTHQTLFTLAQSAESMRIAGSLYGSMQHLPGSLAPQQAVSSYIFPSGAGLGVIPTVSGALPTLSGIGFAASMPPIYPRKFWLVADAELIVYGATEPDATVTIGGQPIQLSPDGTFRFQLSFQDGTIDYPIMAVATDGEQNRSIHMSFERETPERRTNTAEEAQDEWPSA